METTQEFKVGDKVKICPFLKGKTRPKTKEAIVESITDSERYPIKIRYADGCCGTYTATGSVEPGSTQVLFLDN